MIIQATGVLHNIAIQRNQPAPSENYPRTSKKSNNQSRDNGKRNYFTDTYNTVALADRDNFIVKYFSLQ